MMTALPSPVDRLLADVHAWPLFAGPAIHTRALTASDDAEIFELWLAEERAVRPVVLERRAGEDGTVLVFGADTGAPVTVRRQRGAAPEAVRVAAEPGAPLLPAVRGVLAELTESAALPGGHGAWVYTFEDVVRTHGAAAHAYAFLRDLTLWPAALAHIEDVVWDEDGDGVQRVWTTVLADDGARHRIPSLRVLLGSSRVVYKPSSVPPIARAHLGQWSVEQHAGSVTITGRHTVALDPVGIEKVLGPDATVEAATGRVRAALGKHSLDTLEAAKSHAENRLLSHDPALSWDRLGTS
ncbi:hypothetical protein AB0H71_22030 [Nocardia sp. NPDC050697]|uniref:hypothetical protein n=1 Tax=Nocardia sp. NPDC050697 TaxID=3155158 RepID=UPI0033D8E7DC